MDVVHRLLDAGVDVNHELTRMRPNGPARGRFTDYMMRGGTGPLLTFQDTLEESTKFQFGSYFGGGLSYAVDDNSAITLELRQRHMSNASIKRPNSGVNSNYVMLGYYWQLEDW